MIEAPDSSSTRPYLIRALYEWCTDNGFTPYIAVAVDDSVQVPREHVKDGEIVLNVSFDATSSLKLGNEFIEFKARFAGTPRDIMVPLSQVMAIFARENGQCMAFPRVSPKATNILTGRLANMQRAAAGQSTATTDAEPRVVSLASVDPERRSNKSADQPEPPSPTANGPRPSLKRVK